VVKDDKQMITVSGKKIELTHQNKILFPKSKITKGDLISYYTWISKWMLPLIKDRPISMHRFPNGISQEGFFQKNASDYFPKWVCQKSIQSKGKGKMTMVIGGDKPTLVYLANQACITPHIWLSRTDKPDYPDRMIFDLDPPGKDFAPVKKGAQVIKELLDALKLKSFLMTTGSKGLHVVIPIKREFNFTEVRKIAKKIAEACVEKEPKLFTVQHRKAKRGKLIFIDYLRNGFGQTAVAPFAVRAYEKAPIALPIDWKELLRLQSSDAYHLGNIKDKNLSAWKGFNRSSSSLKKLAQKIAKG
jgi:bifunctional non-homologous end joining protein LigD